MCAEIVPVGREVAIVDVADASIDDMFDDFVNIDRRVLLLQEEECLRRSGEQRLKSCQFAGAEGWGHSRYELEQIKCSGTVVVLSLRRTKC